MKKLSKFVSKNKYSKAQPPPQTPTPIRSFLARGRGFCSLLSRHAFRRVGNGRGMGGAFQHAHFSFGTFFYLLPFTFFLFTLPTLAQDPPRPITQDEVNEIAERMYCPVCENIPLDDCGTATCVEWKNEIAVMLQNGFTSDQIVNDFVTRYGEKVVGVPQDPILRTLSLVLPVIGLLLAIIAAALTFTNWNKRNSTPTEMNVVAASDDRYRQQFEQDVK